MSKINSTTILSASNSDFDNFWQGAIADAEEMIRSINAEARARTKELRQSIALLKELRDSEAQLPAIGAESEGVA